MSTDHIIDGNLQVKDLALNIGVDSLREIASRYRFRLDASISFDLRLGRANSRPRRSLALAP